MGSYDLFALDTDQVRLKLSNDLHEDIYRALCNPKKCEFKQTYLHCCQLVACTGRLAIDPVEAVLSSALQQGAVTLLSRHGASPQECRAKFAEHAALLNKCLMYWLHAKNHTGVRDIISEFAEVAWGSAVEEVRSYRCAAFMESSVLDGLTNQLTGMNISTVTHDVLS